MIDQEKIGSFLRALRKEKGKTQEEIAERFGVSSRSVSRWENGNTLPDLGILVELADYYGIDIRELIDGTRRSEKVEPATKETLLKVADYADREKKQSIRRKTVLFLLLGVILTSVVAAAAGLVIFAFSRQYNAKGISSLLCISIDETMPKEYVGELDGYSIYTEKLITNELYFTTAGAETIPLREAVEKSMVSVKDWRKKAWETKRTEGGEILLFENYEILITDHECTIRPISG